MVAHIICDAKELFQLVRNELPKLDYDLDLEVFFCNNQDLEKEVIFQGSVVC